MMHLTESQIILKRAKDSLETYREIEREARAKLNQAVEDTKRAKEKYEHLFLEEEKREFKRLSGK